LGVSLVNAANSFFGCTMRPATASVYTTGSGSIACVSGTDDQTNKMKCSFKYSGLNATSVSAAHLHVGDDTTAAGPPTFYFDVTTNVPASGTAYQSFQQSVTTGTGPHWVAVNSLSFDAQVAQCAGTGGCYFNLHTLPYYGNGELRCELAPLTNTYAFDNVALVPTTVAQAPSTVNNSASHGTASAWMAPVSSNAGAVHAWGYQVSFVTSYPVNNAHIHQGTSVTDNTGGVVVSFDWAGNGVARTTGDFVGVALEGTSAWLTYTQPGFDDAIASSFCYINVHTTGNGAGEIRGNIAPQGSAASHVAVTLMAVVFMIASWVSM